MKNEEKRMHTPGTSFHIAVEMKQFALVARFIQEKPKERARIIREMLNVLIIWWQDEEASKLVNLYCHALRDTFLERYVRKEGFASDAKELRTHDGLRYREYYVHPEDPDWHNRVREATAEALEDVLFGLPRFPEFTHTRPFSFPKLKSALLDGIYQCGGESRVLSDLVSLDVGGYGYVEGSEKEFYISEIRKITERCNLTNCGDLLRMLTKGTENAKPELVALALRSLSIRRTQLADPEHLWKLASV